MPFGEWVGTRQLLLPPGPGIQVQCSSSLSSSSFSHRSSYKMIWCFAGILMMINRKTKTSQHSSHVGVLLLLFRCRFVCFGMLILNHHHDQKYWYLYHRDRYHDRFVCFSLLNSKHPHDQYWYPYTAAALCASGCWIQYTPTVLLFALQNKLLSIRSKIVVFITNSTVTHAATAATSSVFIVIMTTTNNISVIFIIIL